MEKQNLTTFQKSAIKGQAKTSYAILAKIDSLNAKKAKIDEEIAREQQQFELYETGIKDMTGGHHSIDFTDRIKDEKTGAYKIVINEDKVNAIFNNETECDGVECETETEESVENEIEPEAAE